MTTILRTWHSTWFYVCSCFTSDVNRPRPLPELRSAPAQCVCLFLLHRGPLLQTALSDSVRSAPHIKVGNNWVISLKQVSFFFKTFIFGSYPFISATNVSFTHEAGEGGRAATVGWLKILVSVHTRVNNWFSQHVTTPQSIQLREFC